MERQVYEMKQKREAEEKIERRQAGRKERRNGRRIGREEE